MTTSQKTDKDAYRKKLDAQLDEWKAKIDGLEAKARASKADAKIEIENQVNAAKKQWDAAKVKANEVSNASGDAWKELQGGAESAFASLKDAVDRAQSHLR